MSTIQTLHTLVTVSTRQILKDKPESREFSGDVSGHFRGRAVSIGALHQRAPPCSCGHEAVLFWAKWDWAVFFVSCRRTSGVTPTPSSPTFSSPRSRFVASDVTYQVFGKYNSTKLGFRNLDTLQCCFG